MAGSRQLDTAGAAADGVALSRCCPLLLLLLLLSAALRAQSPFPGLAADRLLRAKQLAAEHNWAELARLAENDPHPVPELNYYYGLALAQLGRLSDARVALLSGYRQLPQDKRFPAELAGIEFRQKNYPRAIVWLERALAIDADDEYANDFLATIYFLQGNLQAALKYWNRIGKPHLAAVRSEPEPNLNPVLLDSAFAFAPGSTLTLPGLLTTQARITRLGIFPLQSLQLAAQPAGDFAAVFHSYQRNGWGRTRTEGLIRFFRGIFAQTVYPEYFNIGRSAMNFTSMVRWDKEKRRYAATLSAPLRGNAARRYTLGMDIRNENWDIPTSSRSPSPLLGAMNLRRQAASAEFSFIPSGRWTWSTGVEFSHRDYRNVVAATAPPTELLASGFQLKHSVQLSYELLRVPERRLVISSSAKSDLARIWGSPARLFGKLQGESALHWFPQAHGSDYETQFRLRAGTTFAQSPFDELFQLGLERDNDLDLRAHIGTHDGRKGSAPLGRNYLLFNGEVDKIAYAHPWFNLRLSPFLDSGRIVHPAQALAPNEWLWDTGLQIKAQLFGISVVFTYGKDLRSGNNVWYIALGR